MLTDHGHFSHVCYFEKQSSLSPIRILWIETLKYPLSLAPKGLSGSKVVTGHVHVSEQDMALHCSVSRNPSLPVTLRIKKFRKWRGGGGQNLFSNWKFSTCFLIGPNQNKVMLGKRPTWGCAKTRGPRHHALQAGRSHSRAVPGGVARRWREESRSWQQRSLQWARSTDIKGKIASWR